MIEYNEKYEQIDKEYLKKTILNISDIKKMLNIGKDKAKILVIKIRSENENYYRKKSNFYGLTSISPIHLVLYLGWTRQEYFNFINT